MKNLGVIAVVFAAVLSSSSFASEVFKFKSQSVLFRTANTGRVIQNGSATVYYQYEYNCLTDGIRPSVCVESKDISVNIVDGKADLESFELEKNHLLGRNPSVQFQISGTCEKQEWHPGNCFVSVPLKDWNKAPNVVLMFPLK